MMTFIILRNLPKISLNEWYSGSHWTKRDKIKNKYKLIILSQFNGIFKKTEQYVCNYCFYFKNNPLDASNCVAMVKLIEDIIFENDKWNIIINLNIQSKKSNEDKVEIEVCEL